MRAGETILELFERYAAQRLKEGVKRSDGVQQDRIVIERFAEFVGRKRSLRSISRDEVRDWRDALNTLPRNFTNSNAYRGLTMREAAAKGAATGVQPLSAITQNRYMSTVSPLFRWAVQEGYADANPCDGLHLRAKRQAKQRPTYSAEELNRILSSPLFTGFLKEGAEHKSGKLQAHDWRRWIPLICLFTGARIGEIAQLHVGDVLQEHERWFIAIRNDVEKGQRTKSGKSRLVPVHRTLEAANFLEFVKRQQAKAASSGTPALFPELTPDERDQIGDKPSRFWRTYLRKIGLKRGADGVGAHTFRHTLTDEFRAAGFLDDQFGPLILGHRRASVTAGYGRLPQGKADMLCAMVDAVKFKGVNFESLIARA